jgi:hypothetical protein
MSGEWRIKLWDGQSVVCEEIMPGHMSEREILRTLERLACRHLSPTEIIRSSLRRNHRDYVPLLEGSSGGRPIHIGQNPHYTAEYSDTQDPKRKKRRRGYLAY